MTVGDTPSYRHSHSSVLGKKCYHITKIVILYFLNIYFCFLAPDGRIIVYGGYNTTIITDKLAILDTKLSPFQWTIPKNIVYPIKGNHYGHTSNLYGNYMITAFGN